MHYTDIRHISICTNKTTRSFGTALRFTVAAKHDITPGKKERLARYHAVNSGISSPFQRLSDKPSGISGEYCSRNITVNIVVGIEIYLIFIHKKRIEGIFFITTTWILGRTEIWTVDTCKSSTSTPKIADP